MGLTQSHGYKPSSISSHPATQALMDLPCCPASPLGHPPKPSRTRPRCSRRTRTSPRSTWLSVSVSSLSLSSSMDTNLQVTTSAATCSPRCATCTPARTSADRSVAQARRILDHGEEPSSPPDNFVYGAGPAPTITVFPFSPNRWSTTQEILALLPSRDLADAAAHHYWKEIDWSVPHNSSTRDAMLTFLAKVSASLSSTHFPVAHGRGLAGGTLWS